MKKNILLTLGFSFFWQAAYSEDKSAVDYILRKRLEFYNIRPLKNLPLNTNRPQVELGKRLFSEKKMSGNRRIACLTCHNPKTGTGDAFPMSQTENGKGILKRNSPALFNIGMSDKSFMFWDGRVHYDFKNKTFTTPEMALNGVNPKAKEITSALTSALSAQAIFPLVTHNEMLGEKGENEIADAKDNLQAWDRIVVRLKQDMSQNSQSKSYSQLFMQAYPNTPIEKINIGHVAESIAAFEREEFQSTGSPFQRYLKGDNQAMSHDQKQGLFVFLGNGRCINCHQGSELGNNNLFASVGAPQWGEAPLILDKGRGDVVNESKRNFFFRVPSLLNVSLTAPYMHNGAFQTLRAVINHYDHISDSLNNFEVSNERRNTLPVKVAIEKGPLQLDNIWLSSQSGLTPKLKNRLLLTPIDKDKLEIFLKEALTDSKWSKLKFK
ncbi:MAG: cytochrome c peroxidase [Bacteriovorax sp.]|nr:cytochrome c peroxidase [Bacteriovorax sp.]